MLDKDAVSRRAFLAGSTAAVGFGFASPAFADVNWKKYAGTTIEVNLIKGPRGDLLQKYEASSPTHRHQGRLRNHPGAAAAAEGGDRVQLPASRASTSSHVSYHVQKRQFEKAGWLADLTPS